MTDAVKRNSIREIDALLAGVGARHDQTDIQPGRGGYQTICTTGKFSEKIAPRGDSRLDELKEFGFAPHWHDVAETIGFDAFLAVWSILGNAEAVQGQKNYVYVPRYSVWMNYQRNRLIMSLHNDGLSHEDIKKQLKRDLDEVIGVDRIHRIIAKALKRQ